MLEIIIEIAVILGIVVLQVITFWMTRQRIAQLAVLYPLKSRLRVMKEYLNAAGKTSQEVKSGLSANAEERLRLLEQGKKFLFLHKPSEIHRVLHLNDRGQQV